LDGIGIEIEGCWSCSCDSEGLKPDSEFELEILDSEGLKPDSEFELEILDS